jgi:hypothetical protein
MGAAGGWFYQGVYAQLKRGSIVENTEELVSIKWRPNLGLNLAAILY